MFNSPSLNHLKKGGFESSSISVGSLNQEILVKACFCQNFNLSSLASSYQENGAFAFLTRWSEGGNFLSSLSRFSIFSFTPIVLHCFFESVNSISTLVLASVPSEESIILTL